jgi:hypothetical protein
MRLHAEHLLDDAATRPALGRLRLGKDLVSDTKKHGNLRSSLHAAYLRDRSFATHGFHADHV